MYQNLPDKLLKILNSKECTTVEFKKATNFLPNNLFETICAMLNRNGGHIFLGVDDNGNVVGVNEEKIFEMKKNFANLCNNPSKIKPTVHLELEPYVYNNKIIFYINVYESSDVHMTNNKIYDRNEDGDYDITGNTSLIAKLYIRKDNSYIENTVFQYIKLSDLREDLINKARIMAVNKNSQHPWAKMNNLQLLKSAGLYDKNYKTGEEGFNLACVLLFGKDELIKSVLSYYKTDALLRIENIDRYDDRDDIRTNLIESYDRLMEFVQKHTNDVFYVDENTVRISPRNIIARELIANMLIHREFSNPVPSRLIITKENIITENASHPRNIGYIDLNNYVPYPKNPKIANMFKEIGLADELGSGIKKITKYLKIYNNCEPIFKDDDIFKAIIPLIDEKNEMNKLKNKIYSFIKENNGVNRKQINEFIYPKINKKNDDEKWVVVKIILRELRQSGKIKNTGSNFNSNWVVSGNINNY